MSTAVPMNPFPGNSIEAKVWRGEQPSGRDYPDAVADVPWNSTGNDAYGGRSFWDSSNATVLDDIVCDISSIGHGNITYACCPELIGSVTLGACRLYGQKTPATMEYNPKGNEAMRQGKTGAEASEAWFRNCTSYYTTPEGPNATDVVCTSMADFLNKTRTEQMASLKRSNDAAINCGTVGYPNLQPELQNLTGQCCEKLGGDWSELVAVQQGGVQTNIPKDCRLTKNITKEWFDCLAEFHTFPICTEESFLTQRRTDSHATVTKPTAAAAAVVAAAAALAVVV